MRLINVGAIFSLLLVASCNSASPGANDAAKPVDLGSDRSIPDLNTDAFSPTLDSGSAGCRTTAEIATIPGIEVFQDSCANATVCTTNLQNRLDDARKNQKVLYLPEGNYVVTPPHGSTTALSCVESPTNGTPADMHMLEGRFHPCVIVGSSCGQSKITLADGSGNSTLLSISSHQFNENYNNIVRSLTLSTGNNETAVALNFRAAQGSTVQDTVIDLTGSSKGTGIVGGPGSGGSIVNVTINGGAIGLDYSLPGEQPTVTAVTLNGQTGNAIIKGGGVTFVGAGVSIEDFQGTQAIDNATVAGPSSALTLVDSTIAFANQNGQRSVVVTTHSTYLENVYVKNGTSLVTDATDGGAPNPGLELPPSSNPGMPWQYIAEAAYALHFGPNDGGFAPTSQIWTSADGGCENGCQSYGGTATEVANPPPNLAGSNTGGGGSQHAWSHLPDFQDATSEIVLAGGDIQAALERHTTDNAAVVLAAGEFPLRHTIHLHAHSRLVGIAPTISIIEPDGSSGSDFAAAGRDAFTSQRFLIDTDVGGDTLLAYVGLYNDTHYGTANPNSYAAAVQWKAGPMSQFVSPFENFLNNANPVFGPFFDIQGGGHFYNVWGAQESLIKGPGYRIFRISGQQVNFYEFDIEHAGNSDTGPYGINAEITPLDLGGPPPSNIRLYGVKDESPPGKNCLGIWAHDATDIRTYGNGGNGEPVGTNGGGDGGAPALYFFQNVTSSKIANLVEAYEQGAATDPGHYSILRVDGHKYNPHERPALVVLPP